MCMQHREPLIYITVSQPWCYWHLGPDNSLFCASLVFHSTSGLHPLDAGNVHPTYPRAVITHSVPRHCQIPSHQTPTVLGQVRQLWQGYGLNKRQIQWYENHLSNRQRHMASEWTVSQTGDGLLCPSAGAAIAKGHGVVSPDNRN